MPAGIKANSDGSAAIQVGGTDVITLTSGGAATFVTSPTTVQAGTAAAPSITFSGDTNTGIYSPGADTIAFTEGGVESMRIDSVGNVGVGTGSNTILSTLQLQTPAQTNAEWEGKGLLIKDDTTANSGLALYSRNSEEHYIASLVDSANSYLILGARKSSAGNQVNVMTLRGSGNVGIGTDTPVALGAGYISATVNGSTGGGVVFAQSGTQKGAIFNGANNMYLDVSNSAGNLFIRNTATGATTTFTSGGNFLVARASSQFYGGAATFGVEQTSNLAYAIGVNANGPAVVFNSTSNTSSAVGSITVTASATSYNPSSDGRLKENIQLMTDGLSRVMKLKPVTYNWKIDGSSDDGFIAQDLQEIPEFAHRVNPVGERDGEMYYGVDYMRFVSVLTAAIQEQQAMIDELKAKVAALEGA